MNKRGNAVKAQNTWSLTELVYKQRQNDSNEMAKNSVKQLVSTTHQKPKVVW